MVRKWVFHHYEENFPNIYNVFMLWFMLKLRVGKGYGTKYSPTVDAGFI